MSIDAFPFPVKRPLKGPVWRYTGEVPRDGYGQQTLKEWAR